MITKKEKGNIKMKNNFLLAVASIFMSGTIYASEWNEEAFSGCFKSTTQKEIVSKLGKIYVDNVHSQSLSNEEIDARLIQLSVSKEDIKKIADDYRDEINVGTRLASQISGMEFNRDSMEMKGNIFIGLALLLKRQLEKSPLEDSVNLFNEGENIVREYAPLMHEGINLVIDSMSGTCHASIGHLVEGEIQFEETKYREEIQETEDSSHELIKFTRLIELSKELSDESLTGEWGNYGRLLYTSLSNDKEKLVKKINDEIEKTYEKSRLLFRSRVLNTPEEINSLFNEEVTSFIMDIMRGKLYASRDVRPAKQIIDDVLSAKNKLIQLAVDLVMASNPKMKDSVYLKGQVTDLLNQNWMWKNFMKDAFKTDDSGKQVPNFDNKCNIWQEFFFNEISKLKKIDF